MLTEGYLTPCDPRSSALHRVSCSTAPLLVLYGTKPGCATNALVDAMFTIAPACGAGSFILSTAFFPDFFEHVPCLTLLAHAFTPHSFGREYEIEALKPELVSRFDYCDIMDGHGDLLWVLRRNYSSGNTLLRVCCEGQVAWMLCSIKRTFAGLSHHSFEPSWPGRHTLCPRSTLSH